MVPYTVVQSEDTAVVTAIIDGKVYTAERSHPNYEKLVTSLPQARGFDDEQALVKLFDPAEAVVDYFDRLSERVSVAGGHIYFDGEEVNDGLSSHILRYIEENDRTKAQPLINFMEKVYTNPNEHSREQLFDWLSRRDFAITEDGDFIAYKGVRLRVRPQAQDDAEGGKYPYESISTGRAIVDGQVYTGAIPNGIGAIVEMPRGEVAHDPSVGCHTGLHAGTWSYASNFSQGAVLKVKINPRDVVSVPTDSDWQKIRTCRYTVLELATNQYFGSLFETAEKLDEDFSDDAPLVGDDPLTPVVNKAETVAIPADPYQGEVDEDIESEEEDYDDAEADEDWSDYARYDLWGNRVF